MAQRNKQQQKAFSGLADDGQAQTSVSKIYCIFIL